MSVVKIGNKIKITKSQRAFLKSTVFSFQVITTFVINIIITSTIIIVQIIMQITMMTMKIIIIIKEGILGSKAPFV